jgi:hypothetical protein
VFAGLIPQKRHIRIAHAGDIDTGDTVAYIGLPRDNRTGGSPWFAVTLWFGQPTRTTVASVQALDRSRPSYDELPIPELDLRLRREHRTPAMGTSMPA